MYVDGMSVIDISKKFNISKTTLGSWVTKSGLAREKRVTEKDLDRIRELYLKGYYAKDIAKIVGLTVGGVTHNLRNMGITRHRGMKSLTKNEDYFKDIDTEEKSYWLGFIMADGCVSIYDGQYTLKISLAAKDRGVLERFKKSIESENVIWERDEVFKLKTSSSYGKTFRKCCISISSKKMIESLISLGVKPNKTGSELIPNIREDLKKHFLRGFFDGDGTAYHYPSRVLDNGQYKSPGYGFGFISSKTMLEDIQGLVGVPEKIYKKVGCYNFHYGKKKGKILYDYMYSEATIWLPRKRDIMDRIYGYDSLKDYNKMLSMSHMFEKEEALA